MGPGSLYLLGLRPYSHVRGAKIQGTFNPVGPFLPMARAGAVMLLLTFGYHFMKPVHSCDKYEFGPWALNGLPEDRRFEYVANCGAPQAPRGYTWAEDYSLVPEKS